MATLGDELAEFRIYTAEPQNTGRWSDSDGTTLINEARNYLALLLRWPDATWTNTFPGGQMEFTLPEVLQIDRVYLAGQPIYPTAISALEGTDIEWYDQTGPNLTGAGLPNWNNMPAQAYPVVPNVQMGYPIGMPPGFSLGSRPGYYLRGGNIGVVPMPTAGTPLQIDGIAVPTVLVNNGDIDIYPSFFKHAIAWKAAEIAYIADKQIESAQAAAMAFQKWLPELLSWKRGIMKNKPKGPRVITYRHFYRRGRGY